MKTVVVIPTYNECENIGRLIGEIFGLRLSDLEIVIVDDNSPDRTADIVVELAKQFPIYLIRRNSKLGLGSAYIAGFKKALAVGAEAIVQMDADLSHDPQDIPRLLHGLGQADMVIGSRKISGGRVEGWNWWRKLMSGGAMFFSRTLLRLNTHDVTAGFRCFKSLFLKKLNFDNIKSSGYAFQEEVLYMMEKFGGKILEIPVIFVDRKNGRSKLGSKDIVEFFRVIIKLLHS